MNEITCKDNFSKKHSIYLMSVLSRVFYILPKTRKSTGQLLLHFIIALSRDEIDWVWGEGFGVAKTRDKGDQGTKLL